MKTFNIWWLALLCTLRTGIGANDQVPSLAAVAIASKACRVSPSACPRITAPTPTTAPRWWYLTGNLKDEQGTQLRQRSGPFRQGIEQEITSDNPWLTPQLWLAQFAITDVSKGNHQQDERTSRQGEPRRCQRR